MKTIAAAVALSLACAGAAWPEERGGLRGDLMLGLGVLRYDSATSGLGAIQLGVSSKTRTQTLRFDLDLERLSRLGTQGEAALSYVRKTKSSQLDAQLRYGVQAAGAFAFEPSTDTGFLDVSGADAERRYGLARLGLRTGLNGPIGLEIDLRHRKRSTAQQTGRQSDFDAALRFDLSKRSSAKLRFGVGKFQGEGGTNFRQTSRRLALAVSHDLNSRLRFEGFVGQRVLRPRGLRQSGAEWGLNLTRTGNSRETFLKIGRRFTASGGLTQAEFGAERTFDTGRLRYALGAARLSGGDTEPVASLHYSEVFDATTVQVGLSRSFAASELTTGVRIAARASLRVQHAISEIGALDVRIDLIRSDASTRFTKQSLGQVRVAYTHNLNSDWALASGAQRRISRDGAAAKTSSTGVFLRLERRFSGGL